MVILGLNMLFDYFLNQSLTLIIIPSLKARIKILTVLVVSDGETGAKNCLLIIFRVFEGTFDLLSFKLVLMIFIGICVKEDLKIKF